MKQFLLAAGLVLLTGCNSGPVQKMDTALGIKPDPMSAFELVKKYPTLQQVCDLSGGCDKVHIECTSYDGSGNSSIRNETVSRIEVENVPGLGRIGGIGFSSMGGFKEAIHDWILIYHMLEQEKKDRHDQPIIYPNAKPCDLNCTK